MTVVSAGPEMVTPTATPEKITTVDGLRSAALRMQELADGALVLTTQQAAGDLAEARRIALGISGEDPQTSLLDEEDLPEYFAVCAVASIADDVERALDPQHLDGASQIEHVQGLIRDLLQEIDAAEASMLEERALYEDGEEAAITAGDAPPLTCGRCHRSVTGLVADDYELICADCAAGHALDEAPVAACDNASVGVVRRVVFGDELGEGTTVLEPCRGPRVCPVTAGQHCQTAIGFTPSPDFHRLTLQRLRRNRSGWITAVVTDQDGIEQPWQSGQDVPVRVVATTLPVPPAGTVAATVSVPDPVTEWVGIPADPRWDPYRLRMAGPRWWRPWWTAHVEYLGAWTTHGDQTIIRARSWRRTKSLYEAADALVDHCRWLTEGPYANTDLVPVVWLGARLIPVAQLAGHAAGGGDR